MSLEMMERDISAKLSKLFDKLADTTGDWYSIWEAIKKVGTSEGFNEKQLQEIASARIRKVLEAKGFTGRQVTEKIYYLKNREEKIEKVKEYQESRKFPIDYHNNDIEQSSRQELILEDTDEVARLRTQLTEAHEVIKKMSFSDNPDVFMMNKATEFPNERYFESVSAMEAIGLLKSFVPSKEQRIEIAWRIIENE